MFTLLLLIYDAFITCNAEAVKDSIIDLSRSIADKIAVHRERSHQLMNVDYCIQHYVSINTCDQLALLEYDAIEALLEAYGGSPFHDYIDATYLSNIFIDEALILSSMNRHDEAISKYRLALSIFPSSVTALSNLAYYEYSINRNHQASHDLYYKALDIDGGNAIVYYNFGFVILTHLYSPGSEHFPKWNISQLNFLWSTALSLNPTLYQIYSNIASSIASDPIDINRNCSAAINAAVMGGHRNDSVFWSLIVSKYSSGLPIVMPFHYNTLSALSYSSSSSSEQIKHIRTKFYLPLIEILSLVPWSIVYSNLDEAVGHSSLGYYALYHGYEDLFMRQVYASVFWKMAFSLIHFMPTDSQPELHLHPSSNVYTYEYDEYGTIVNVSLSSQVATTATSSDTSSCSKDRIRIRVGFLSAFFYKHSVGLLLQGVIKGISKQTFDVYILSLVDQPRNNSELKQYDKVLCSLMDARDATYMDISSSLPMRDIQLLISELHLDVIVFAEVGMHVKSYFLAFAQLATKSVLFWGHAVTSGIHQRLFEYQYRNIVSHHNNYNYNNISESLLDIEDRAYLYIEDNSSDDRWAIDQHWLNDSSFTSNYNGMDYFVSSELFETSSMFAQYEYSERLLLQSGLTTYFEWPDIPLSEGDLQLLVYESFEDSRRQAALVNDPHHYRIVNISIDRMQFGRFEALSQFNYSIIDSIHETNQRCQKYMQVLLPSKREFLVYLQPSLHDILPPSNKDFNLYVIPQSIMKLHRDFDIILRHIFFTDLRSYIVFPIGLSVDTFIRRFNSSLYSDNLILKKTSNDIHGNSNDNINDDEDDHDGDDDNDGDNDDDNDVRDSVMSRLLILRHMNEREYLTLCGIADIVLDPFPVGGGRSSLEIFSVNAPIIALRSRTSILQLTSAMYHVMGLQSIEINCNTNVAIVQNRSSRSSSSSSSGSSSHVPSKASTSIVCCVVDTMDDYITLAVTIAMNRKLHFSIQQLIGENSYRLFENTTVIEEWEKMLLYIHRTPRPQPTVRSLADMMMMIHEEKDKGIGYNDESQFLTMSVDYLLSNASSNHWRHDELQQVLFTYTAPPIILRNIHLIDHCFLTSSTSSSKPATTTSSSAITTTTTTATSSSPSSSPHTSSSSTPATTPPLHASEVAVLFEDSFYLDESMTRMLTITVHEGEDWRQCCWDAIIVAGVVDRLKILYLCNIVGK